MGLFSGGNRYDDDVSAPRGRSNRGGYNANNNNNSGGSSFGTRGDGMGPSDNFNEEFFGDEGAYNGEDDIGNNDSIGDGESSDMKELYGSLCGGDEDDGPKRLNRSELIKDWVFARRMTPVYVTEGGLGNSVIMFHKKTNRPNSFSSSPPKKYVAVMPVDLFGDMASMTNEDMVLYQVRDRECSLKHLKLMYYHIEGDPEPKQQAQPSSSTSDRYQDNVYERGGGGGGGAGGIPAAPSNITPPANTNRLFQNIGIGIGRSYGGDNGSKEAEEEKGDYHYYSPIARKIAANLEYDYSEDQEVENDGGEGYVTKPIYAGGENMDISYYVSSKVSAFSPSSQLISRQNISSANRYTPMKLSNGDGEKFEYYKSENGTIPSIETGPDEVQLLTGSGEIIVMTWDQLRNSRIESVLTANSCAVKQYPTIAWKYFGPHHYNGKHKKRAE